MGPIISDALRDCTRLTCVRVSLRQTSTKLGLFSLRGLSIHILVNALHAQCLQHHLFSSQYPHRENFYLESLGKMEYLGISISIDRSINGKFNLSCRI